MKKETDLPVQDICRDDKCRFGKWLATVTPDDKNQHHLSKVRSLHSDFHKNAGAVAQKIADGDSTRALADLEGATFAAKSQELTAALMEWKIRG